MMGETIACVAVSPHPYGGSGGFFLACEDFGRMFDNSFPACAFSLKWRFFEVDLLQALRGKKKQNFESSGFFADGALISASAYPISGSNEGNHRELDRSALN